MSDYTENNNKFVVFILTEDKDGNILDYEKQYVETLKDGKDFLSMIKGWNGAEAKDGYVVPIEKEKEYESRIIHVINGGKPSMELPGSTTTDRDGAYYTETHLNFVKNAKSLYPNITKEELTEALVHNFDLDESISNSIVTRFMEGK